MIWDNDMAWLYGMMTWVWSVSKFFGDPTAFIPQPSDVNWDELRILDALQRSSCLGQFPLKSTLPSRKLSYTGICWGLVFCFWPAFHFGWRWISVINAPVYLHFDTPVASSCNIKAVLVGEYPQFDMLCSSTYLLIHWAGSHVISNIPKYASFIIICRISKTLLWLLLFWGKASFKSWRAQRRHGGLRHPGVEASKSLT